MMIELDETKCGFRTRLDHRKNNRSQGSAPNRLAKLARLIIAFKLKFHPHSGPFSSTFPHPFLARPITATTNASKAFPDFPILPELEISVASMPSPPDHKRKAEEDAGTASTKKLAPPPPLAVNPKRVRALKPGTPTGNGPVIYWMSRDQRVRDNWALLYACQQASRTGAPVAVAFNLVTDFLGAGARQFSFMLRGLRLLAPKLQDLGIPFFLLQGDPVQTIPTLVRDSGASLLVTDFGPLRLGRQWREGVAAAIQCPFHEVDTHNVVPVWEASGMFVTCSNLFFYLSLTLTRTHTITNRQERICSTHDST